MSPRITTLALAAVLAAAPAFAADEEETIIRSSRAQVEAFAGAPVDSVAHRPIRANERWEAIPDYAVVIWASSSKAWLVDLDRGNARCEDLSQEYLMHLQSSVNWLSTRSGYIDLHDGSWCRITGIRPVDVKGLRADRRAKGLRSAY